MIIDFSSTGEAQAMHLDEFDLGFLGTKEIERASEIKFNKETQRWDILLPCAEGWHQIPQAMGFHTYNGARKIEVKWLDACRLEEVSPLSIPGLAALRFLRGINHPDL